MTDYGTIKIPQEAYNKHNEHRKELRMTWEEYIGSEAPDTDGKEMGDLEDRLDRIEEAAKEATNAAQSAEAKIEGLQR